MVKTKKLLPGATRKRACRVCGKQFTQMAALTQHLLSHTTNAQQKLNYDNSAKHPNQAREESMFGSSATEHAQSRPAISQGIQQAVASMVGSTPDGRAWALAALHPCGAGEFTSPNVGTVVGMCDTMTGSVATPVYRAENHLAYSASLFTDPPAAPTTFGIDIIIPPIPEIDYIYRFIDDSTGAKTDWIVERLEGYELPVAGRSGSTGGDVYAYTIDQSFPTMSNVGYGKVRQIACGHTFELDASAMNNQGRVVVGQMEGQWLWIPIGPPNYTTSNFVTAVTPDVTTAPAVTRVSSPNDTTGVWKLIVPTDTATVTANCPNAYQGLAKHGAYVVSKFSSPLLGYEFKFSGSGKVYRGGTNVSVDTDPDRDNNLPTTALVVASDTNSDGLAGVDNFWNKDRTARQRSAFGTYVAPITVNGNDNLVQKILHPGVSAPSDMMTAVVMFRNLPVTATNINTASVRVKSRNFYECISNGLNPAVAPYVHPPAEFDFPALNSVIVAGKKLSDAYPASANSLGTIFGKIWGAIKSIVQPVANVVSKAGIPILSTAAEAVDLGVRGADYLIDRMHKAYM